MTTASAFGWGVLAGLLIAFFIDWVLLRHLDRLVRAELWGQQFEGIKRGMD